MSCRYWLTASPLTWAPRPGFTGTRATRYVPGTGSQPSKLEGDMERVDRMTDQAENSGASKPVTVAWMGYDAPPGLGDATQRDYAQAGGPALNAFQDGLRVNPRR
ncbi:alpha/beta hydrolase [Nocardia rhizosphaerihabitans]|uniref:alpha/beta hydrolase n=1 Tax=Nocardia rhizosphaerihabitans TaxID=1691570 RepID=UPI0036722B36